MATPLHRAIIATDPYSTVVLAKGPVGYWRLGESVGPTATDSSGNDNNGVYFGSPGYGQPGAIAGSVDTAIGLKGFSSGDYVEIADPAGSPFSQPTSGAGLSVEVWMRPDALVFPGQTAQPYIHWLGRANHRSTSGVYDSTARTPPSAPIGSPPISGTRPAARVPERISKTRTSSSVSGITSLPVTTPETGPPIPPPV